MKFFIVLLVVAATAYAVEDDVLPNGDYLPPNQDPALLQDLSQFQGEEAEPAHELADDGYRYKTIRRLKYRQRRDVNELKNNNEYLPPSGQGEEAGAPGQEGFPPNFPPQGPPPQGGAEGPGPGQEGFPPNFPPQGPPPQEGAEGPAPGQEGFPPQDLASRAGFEQQEGAGPEEGAAPQAPEQNPEQPPQEGEAAPPSFDFPPNFDPSQGPPPPPPAGAEGDDSAVLRDDGYHYKTVRRIRYRRRRRDVSELKNTGEYLPPTTDNAEPNVDVPAGESEAKQGEFNYDAATSQDYKSYEETSPQELPEAPVRNSIESNYPSYQAQDNYAAGAAAAAQPQPDYQGQYQQQVNFAAQQQQQQYQPQAGIATAAQPAYQGQYQQQVNFAAPQPQYQQQAAFPAYQFPAGQYEASAAYQFPAQANYGQIEATATPAPAAEAFATSAQTESDNSGVLEADGYHYKTVKRVKYRYRHRRQAPDSEYLPPVQDNEGDEVSQPTYEQYEPTPNPVPAQTSEPEPAHLLEADGYHYKTARKLRYRFRN